MRTFTRAFLLLVLSTLAALGANELPQFKPIPTRPSSEADVIIEWSEILEECFEEKICVQGHLYNQGKKTANQVKLRVEIGGSKHIPPRVVLIKKLEQTTMNPGDRQDFDITIDRKVPYKDHKGEEKLIEVGKYNFKIVPTWAKAKEPKGSSLTFDFSYSEK